MQTNRFIRNILIIILTIMFSNTYAISLRCGVRLITEGDPKGKVLAECGEPDHVDIWEEERVYRYYYKPNDDYRYYDEYLEPHYVKDHVIIEEWTYNHGPHRFMDYVRFENGRVRKIVSGDYGY